MSSCCYKENCVLLDRQTAGQKRDRKLDRQLDRKIRQLNRQLNRKMDRSFKIEWWYIIVGRVRGSVGIQVARDRLIAGGNDLGVTRYEDWWQNCIGETLYLL